MSNRCIIMASGASIKEGLPFGLSNYLEREVVFSINDNIKFVDSTVAIFGDHTCYRDRFELFNKHPLVIGRYDSHIGRTIEGSLPCPKHDGLILLPSSNKYHGDKGLELGLYSGVLTGAFTLNLAIRLGFKQIFLLGFDCGATGKSTHWYDESPDAGQFTNFEGKPITGVGINEYGKYNTEFYNKEDGELNLLWYPFQVEKEVKIYNVSLNSRISVFDKIGYNSMFTILNSCSYNVNQVEVQNEIRKILTPYNKG